MIEYAYRYAQPSQVEQSASGSRIHLVTTQHPQRQAFFAGSLTAPRRAADLMLALVQVVNSRFYTPPAMVARILANADPVITCGAERLRLEGFSACCGVYARLDLLPGAFDAERAQSGTTNVDFNPPMRASLTRLRDGEPARLTVSAGEFELATRQSAVIERKVKLPTRWLKGFVEVQTHQARMTPRFTISGAMAQRFLRETPRSPVRTPLYLTPAGPAVRISQSPLPGSIPAGGMERLRILEPIVRHAQSLTVYAGSDAATAWELTTPHMRFFLVLSPEPSRGFSGEGQALFHLAAEPAQKALGAMRGALRWQSRIEAAAIAAELAIDETSAAWALAQLGASGLVGYDLAEACYFHRELPFDFSLTKAQRARSAPPEGEAHATDTGRGRAPFCAWPLEAQRARSAPPEGEEHATDTGRGRAPFCAWSLEAQRARSAPPEGEAHATDTGRGPVPFSAYSSKGLQPRLKSAHKLVAEAAVRFEAGEAWVRGTGVEHRVRKVDGEWRCTCPWIGKHGLGRGPCKHILAVRIAQGDDNALD